MDQVKAQLAVAMKYGFWIGTSIIFLASLGVWFMTTSKLAEESAAQTSAINGAISTVSGVQSELSTLPNEHSHKVMNQMIAARQDEVLESWKTLYERQRDILTWPVKELRQDFVDEFKHMIPIETYVEFPTAEADEKETTLRNQYARYIKNILPSIAEICNTEWTAEFESRGGMEMGMMDMEGGGDYGMGGMMMMGPKVDITGAEDGPLVEWSKGSQETVLKDLFPWRGSMPSTLEVYYSQENIWILKQLLQIVDEVNGEATQSYQAKIHEIRGIGIGKSVKFGAGNISKPGSRATAAGMGMGMGMEMEMEMDDMDMYGGDMMEMGGMGGLAGPGLDPAENRYVDTNMEPIAGATLRTALSSNSPNDAALAVAKRVPVMMSLSMDQRAIHELLSTCGSSPLMVEVKHVRLLPKGNTNSFGGGMMGGMDEMDEMGGEMEMGGMGGMGGMMGGGMMGMGGGGGGAMAADDEFPLDMLVEIYGIIYMYNPPDPVKLGVEQVTEDTVVDGETIGGEKAAPAPAAQPGIPANPTAPATPADEGQTPPVATTTPVTPPAMIPVAQP